MLLLADGPGLPVKVPASGEIPARDAAYDSSAAYDSLGRAQVNLLHDLKRLRSDTLSGT